jgi:hypothetical protein
MHLSDSTQNPQRGSRRQNLAGGVPAFRKNRNGAEPHERQSVLNEHPHRSKSAGGHRIISLTMPRIATQHFGPLAYHLGVRQTKIPKCNLEKPGPFLRWLDEHHVDAWPHDGHGDARYASSAAEIDDRPLVGEVPQDRENAHNQHVRRGLRRANAGEPEAASPGGNEGEMAFKETNLRWRERESELSRSGY